MPDSLLDLDIYNILEPPINWRQSPKTGFETALQVQEFTGTSNEVIVYDNQLPEKFDFLVTLKTKAEKLAFVRDYISKKGRVECFWFVDLSSRFTLEINITAVDTNIVVKDNQFAAQGFERLYIEKKDGTKFTRKINSSVAASGQITLAVTSALGEQVNIEDVKIITLLHFSRFDNDELRLRNINQCHRETAATILALPKEQQNI